MISNPPRPATSIRDRACFMSHDVVVANELKADVLLPRNRLEARTVLSKVGLGSSHHEGAVRPLSQILLDPRHMHWLNFVGRVFEQISAHRNLPLTEMVSKVD